MNILNILLYTMIIINGVICIISRPYKLIISVLEITVGHWPFSDQFQHLADQNPFWSAKFTENFQWDGN